ncbi:type VII secretion protein EccB [Streptomyces candidus]|uniref:Type VII secretion protein EccB n=1 Tax=Streptomyces candidus TaxID=67283 RepID=A0A7X0HIR6_9ACTN|nr:type VII secretion protein EccB [Streptomyces candidus]MBB6438437.1 type VII secretion protein EccB [Streptomyces candidus]GHH52405.1 type VII secretion protein EccB [Streptomyces candidus]
MASRRDELNAYTFAKRRLVAQFLRPSPNGSEEGAPRPLRAVLPGVLVGAVTLAGAATWGLWQPAAPEGWEKPRQNVIVASRSTARYVVLDLDGTTRLHPVLNMSSARLLLEDDAKGFVKVDDRVLDESGLDRGPAVGIPYAPDRLPDPGEAVGNKSWAVCERPGPRAGRSVQRVVFVLAGNERRALADQGMLKDGELLYVRVPDGSQHVVDVTGTAYRLAPARAPGRVRAPGNATPADPQAPDPGLLSQVVGPRRAPQQVSARWLETLPRGGTIGFPAIGAKPGVPTRAPRVPPPHNEVGKVVVAGVAGGRQQHYLVLPDRIAPVSDLMARLLVTSPELSRLHPGGAPFPANGGFAPGAPFEPPRGAKWPQHTRASVNSPSPVPGSRNTVCSVLRGVDGTGAARLGVWAGAHFPQALPAGDATVYVTPGSGQYFRQFKGKQTRAGTDYLLTDTGLRHALQNNADTTTGPPRPPRKDAAAPSGPPMTAAQLLGYGEKRPVPIPAAWSELLPTGPRLSTGAAQQPQGS